MNKKKIIAPLSLFCLSAVMISAVGCSEIAVKDAATDTFKEWITESEKNEGAMIASAGESHGIRLTSASFTLTCGNKQSFSPGQNYDYSKENAYNSVRITAKAEEGSSVPLTGATWKVSFTDKSKGGNASDYVSLSSVSANGLSVQVNVKQAFASEITVTAVSTDNPNVTGSITLQYVRRVDSISLSLPVVSLISEKEYSLSVNGTIGAGTLMPAIKHARYVKFSSTFSGDSGTYYPIEKTMTGTAWKAFLIEHAKDETALETMLASADGNDGYVGIYCTATVTYNGKTYQFITSEAFYPKFTNDAILTGSVTTGDNVTVITPPDSSLEGSDNTGTEGGSGESQETVVEYIETETESITIDMAGGDGDYTVTVDEKLQDKVTVEVTDGTITVTNNSDEPVAGTVTVGSGNQTVDIPVAFITELTTSETEIVVENASGTSSEITVAGGTGEYTVEVSDSLKDYVTVTQDGKTITLSYQNTEDVSGTVKITSGSQSQTINVLLTAEEQEDSSGGNRGHSGGAAN